MQQTKRFFKLAKQIAKLGDSKNVFRKYRVGAVGIRRDGTIVGSSNIPCFIPESKAHAEARLTKKLDVGSVVYVVRIDAKGGFRLAKPCRRCEAKMAAKGVRKCYYSIENDKYGSIKFNV